MNESNEIHVPRAFTQARLTAEEIAVALQIMEAHAAGRTVTVSELRNHIPDMGQTRASKALRKLQERRFLLRVAYSDENGGNHQVEYILTPNGEPPVPEPIDPWEPEGRLHTVYRCFDAAGDLLYVGMTKDLQQRMKAHQARSRWWDEFDHCAEAQFIGRRAAAIAEALAIRDEAPKFNRRGVITEWATVRVEPAPRKARIWEDNEVSAPMLGRHSEGGSR
ncbi:GIY-YIG nuclease family protein [Glycomyces sp. YM15]|uniref:GIY-YIG nuclease family protein n=1 Tax=Glycomyces sp. YM15 TaxID=2800446 RepID=UPI0019661850|nr:GIY-YIG nuclease family protein [Glycomyces sp. YM15]